MEYQIGDEVRYIPGHHGWHMGTVTGFDGRRYVIELANGKEIIAREDELEEK